METMWLWPAQLRPFERDESIGRKTSTEEVFWHVRLQPRNGSYAPSQVNKCYRDFSPVGELRLRNDIRVARNLLKATLLFHPDSGESKLFGLPDIRHLAAPDHRFATCQDHGAALNVRVFDAALVRGDHEKS